MTEPIGQIEDQFIFLARELSDAEAALRRDRGDSVDSAQQQRLVDSLRQELEALKVNNRDVLSDPTALEVLARQPRPAGDSEDAMEQRSGALAVVIGHSPQGDMGNNGVVPPFPADTRNARTEYYWNRDVAERIKSLGLERGYDVEIFHRWKSGSRFIPEAYDPVRSWQPEATVEIHFNGNDTPVQGTETLHLKDVANSAQWAQALQDKMVALYARKKSDRSDRGLKPKGSGERGAISLRQIHPSALIEPFFGDSPADAVLGVARKLELADAVVDAFAAYSRHVPTSASAPATGAEDTSDDDTPAAALTITPRFDETRKLYAATPIEFPTLRDITFAQWAHESDFGRSELARDHQNFGGMKWLNAMAPLAKRVRFRPAHDPDGRDYCGFETLANFIAGYWHRLDLPSLPYSSRNGGWRRHAETPDMFLDFIGPIWAPRGGTNSPFNARYEEKVRKRYRQLRDAHLLPSIVSLA